MKSLCFCISNKSTKWNGSYETRFSEAKQMKMPSVIRENENVHTFLSCYSLEPNSSFSFCCLFIYIIKYQHVQLESSSKWFLLLFWTLFFSSLNEIMSTFIRHSIVFTVYFFIPALYFSRHSRADWLSVWVLLIKQRNPVCDMKWKFSDEKRKKATTMYGF